MEVSCYDSSKIFLSSSFVEHLCTVVKEGEKVKVISVDKKPYQTSVISSKLAFSDHWYLSLWTIDNLIINLRVFIPQLKPELFPNFCLYQYQASSKSTLHKSRIVLLEKICYTSKYASALFSQLWTNSINVFSIFIFHVERILMSY